MAMSPELLAKPGNVPPRTGELARIGSYLIPGWRPASLILLCIAVVTACSLIPPLIIRIIIDRVLPVGDAAELCWLVAIVIVTAILGGLAGVYRNYLGISLGQSVIFELRCCLYERLLRQSLDFFTRVRSGEILSRIQNDVGGVQAVVNGTLVTAFANAVTLLCSLAVIFCIDWRLALLASFILPWFILPTRKAGKSRGQISKETQESLAEMSSVVQETLSVSGALLVRLFGAEETQLDRFRKKAARVRDLQVRGSMVGRWFLMWVLLFSTIGPALIYLVGGLEVISGKVTVGTVVAFVAYLGQLYVAASGLVNTHVEIATALQLFRRIFEYLDMSIDVVERSDAVCLKAPLGELRFENVSMSYSSGTPALTDVSFEARAGQMVAIVGPSGAGKTTIAYLAARLYDPKAGRVLFDSVDLRQLRFSEISQWIAKVTQEVTLFNATIEENLRYAKADATPAELERACTLAQIHDVIATLPQGYSTLIGERGYRLSGGERQRIAIARVLLRDPRLLILDEATSALDSRSEALVQRALETVLRGRTSIVIAHRLSTILRADMILVLDAGRVVERGTHHELLQQAGLYARLYETQFRAATA